MARLKSTAIDRMKSGTPPPARKTTKAPRKTILSKKTVARKALDGKHREGRSSSRRARPGAVAAREVAAQQKRTDNVIPLAPFSHLVREITAATGATDIRFQSTAIQALQNAAESTLIQILGDCQTLANHANRVTVMDKDLRVFLRVVRPSWYRESAYRSLV
ncbi:histone H3 [Giardia muris]|uniref:Histone H3 n=1 Tax=Giardia muris TaxID=5742 RepID=A0A4Z1SY43_GIAMU|nr:histone H3 [Giardia muris]TNJ30430.1 histone H3 [Giardia muris]|eukprot:TNJ30367.1 histone H3 [Giardia muris]